jgi:hypothetical protein
MKKLSIPYYYKVYKCIGSSRTIEQIETCERMINNIRGLIAVEYLADLALLKKVDLMAAQYPEVEV